MSEFLPDNIWYCFDDINRKDALFNMITGGRGTGKTYNAKKMCINNFINNNEEFVWIRRYQTELDELCKEDLFFADILEEFPNHNFHIAKNTCFCDDKPMGYFIPLTCSRKYKSVPYPNVTSIVFDEFMIGKKDAGCRYLYKEVNVLLNLISTIGRLRDNYKVYLIGNYEIVSNPYFEYFGIYPVKGQRFVRKGEVLLDNYKNKAFVDYAKNTRFGKLIADSKFGSFAIDNTSLEDNEDNVKPFGSKMTFIIGFIVNDIKFGIWVSEKDEIYISKKLNDNGCIKVFDDVSSVCYFTKYSQLPIIQNMKKAADYGELFFEDIVIKRQFIDNFSMIL